ncbi:MAG TPA: porin [Polyangiaceae bacterium]|nr:porin [Polyangiaceae bacterium]
MKQSIAAAMNAAPAKAPAASAAPAVPPNASEPEKVPAKDAAHAVASSPAVDINGYMQVEYQWHADSKEQLLQGVTPLNQNRFVLRRARLLASRAWDYTSLELELDANTVNGSAIGINRAEAAAFYRGGNDPKAAPLAQLTVGVFRVPFGRELPESSGKRWFMERSLLTRALFPSENDLGARLTGQPGPFRYGLSITNGEPANEKIGFPLQDPNKNKDFTFSVGAKGKPLDHVTVGGGVSVNKGKGFHSGTPATKNSIAWTDLNENGAVEPTEIVSVAAQAAQLSRSFKRWAIGADLELNVDTPIGTSSLFGEVIAAKNLDRGFFVADPVLLQNDMREFGFYIGFLQQITPYGLVGFRAEFYDPNADLSARRAGTVLPEKNSVRTYSPLIGVTLPDRARLSFQYDIIKDHLARNSRGQAADLSNNAWTLRLQVNL